MSNLTLVTTEQFNEVSCNFYRNMNDDILLTREQIGEALEYNYPADAIRAIHRKHRDRLDELSIKHKIDKGAVQTELSFKGGSQDTYLYTERGIMEICRWSRQPKANEFMDWCWDIVEDYRRNKGNTTADSHLLNTVTNMCTALTNSINAMQQQNSTLSDMMTTFVENNTKTKHYKSPTFPAWLNKVKPQMDQIREHYYPEDTKYKRTYNLIFKEFNNTYGDSYLSQLVDDFCYNSGYESAYTMDIVAHDKEARTLMETVITNIISEIDENQEENRLSQPQ